MKKIILFSLFATANIILFSQTKNDSILLYEKTIERPLTLHEGQLQFNTGYSMSIISANFNENGDKTNLAELGNASVLHKYTYEIGYGFFDFFELSIALNYEKKGIRKTNEIYISVYDPSLDISYLDNYKGFNDLYIGTGFSYPVINKSIELYIEPGISLPIFSNEPDKPEHEIIPPAELGDFTKINYIYNYKNAMGAKVFHFNAGAKLRANNLALTFLYESSYPMNISESIKWNHRLSNNEFEYNEEGYEFLISDQKYFLFKSEFQALAWFNLNLGFSGLSFKNGWSEISQIRLPNPETKLYQLTIGCEIKVTGKLWLTQFVSFPIAGKNQVAPVSFITNFSYNLFAFK